jgi:hypothetical protein
VRGVLIKRRISLLAAAGFELVICFPARLREYELLFTPAATPTIVSLPTASNGDVPSLQHEQRVYKGKDGSMSDDEPRMTPGQYCIIIRRRRGQLHRSKLKKYGQ